MTAQKKEYINVMTPELRMSYPNLVTPRGYENPVTRQKGTPEYSVEGLIPTDKLGEFVITKNNVAVSKVDIRQYIMQLTQEKWPGINVQENLTNKMLRWPIASGDAKAEERERAGKDGKAYKGHYILRMKSPEKNPPHLHTEMNGRVVELSRGNAGDMAIANEKFTGGNYAQFIISLAASEVNNIKYVTVYVNRVAFSRPGEKLGGFDASASFSVFQGITGGQSSANPFGSLEIPL